MEFSDKVSELKGAGPDVTRKLKILGVETVGDLIADFPRRYDDYSVIQPIRSVRPGPVTICGNIKAVTGRYSRRGLHVTEAAISDDSGSLRAVWFNQPYRAASLKPDELYYLSGEFQFASGRLSLINPSIERAGDFPINTARIVPVYRETKGLKSGVIRKLLSQVVPYLQKQPETLPKWIISENKLMARPQALKAIHFPDSAEELAYAKRRLGFEEVFELTMASLMNKYELHKLSADPINFDVKLAQQFVASLPFQLTDAQRKVIWQIYMDMAKDQPMNRLVEGDVGSGKTVVATMAALMALTEGHNVAFMAPTELLANQHSQTVRALLLPLGMENKVNLLTGSLAPKAKAALKTQMSTQNAQIYIGTHALIQSDVAMHSLALVIVDEQHRFGVAQRKELQRKAGYMPHVLAMSATPIPRSLALTLFGDLDLSVIDSMPPGRQPVKTSLVLSAGRVRLYEKLNIEIESGRQIFIVCPVITEGSLAGTSVEAHYKTLSAGVFKNRRVGLLHGKMKASEKDSVMESFVKGNLDILVSTTVIEVGVDVPNATVMVIEDADRFGLAQIHQLRGRVGRGEHQGYCYLMLGQAGAQTERLRALVKTSDGFELAELDLSIRGPGAIYGTMQHGVLDLRVASLSDTKLIAAARRSAQAFIDKRENLLQYHQLAKRVAGLRAVTNLN